MSLSAVAGIVDKNGGWRVVVTQRWRMHNHVGKGERIFVVPGLKVQEPVPWDEIPQVIAKAEKHTVNVLETERACGTCRQCCLTLFIKTQEWQKPSHQWCEHSSCFGCKIYKQRPLVCEEFKCGWLKSQTTNEPMAPELRPDRCGVILTTDTTDNNPNLIEMHADIPEQIKREPMASYVAEQEAKGKTMKQITFYYGENV